MVDILERPFTVTPKIIKSLKAGRAENHLLIPLTLTTIYPRVDESKLGGSPRIVDTKVRKIEESLQPTPSSCTQRGVLVLPHDFPAREILNQMGKQFEVFVDTDFDADSISEDLSRPIEGSMGALPKHSYKVGEALDVIAVARSIHGGYKAWLARKQSDKEKGWEYLDEIGVLAGVECPVVDELLVWD
ncbi:hypothetical protein DOTSEDRAFT_24273 [Dothistroma septosporum NZE10]|uniref:Uncharacterized protein n=1 Tax=Dothistroma septosporum (strain NZE10 / CBS 128990) TaxID=675120 RepID=N1PL27_DOTSN|nr:hypothetical protein DOTSEDRAFT_24273 [Dothistroma septosporum NZE10]